MSRCLGRLVSEKVRGQFRDGHYFHIELRCENSAEKEKTLCAKCEARPRTQMRTHATCLHGLIGGEIPAWSHVFGSAWYLSKVEAYGQPSESEMVRAKKAIADNLAGGAAEKTASIPAPLAAPVATPVADATPVKPKGRPRKLKIAASESVPLPVAEPVVQALATAPAAKPKAKRKPKTPVEGTSAEAPAAKPKAKRKLKIAASETLPVEVTAPVDPVAIESAEPVQTIAEEDILVVRVRPFEHNGTTYWLHGAKDKLYTVPKKDELPKYVGRYNRSSETIDHDFPDSDEEQ